MSEFDTFYTMVLLLPLSLILLSLIIYKNRGRLSSKNTFLIIGWNLLLSCIVISILFFAMETQYRFFVDTSDSFGLNKIAQRWENRHYQHNNMETRDSQNYQPKIAAGKSRVTFFGDSFTAGYGVKDVEDRFANLIRKSNPELEIHVLAKNGSETINELNWLKELASNDNYEFDVIILVYNLNDIAWLSAQTAEIYQRIYAWEDEAPLLVQNSYFLNTMYFRWLVSRDPNISEYYDYVLSSYFAQEWQEQSQTLKQIADLAEHHNADFGVITFPFLHEHGAEYDFQEVHSQLDNLWHQNNIPHMDLLNLFEKNNSQNLVVSAWDAHPNELAHEIAADAIQAFIEREFSSKNQ